MGHLLGLFLGAIVGANNDGEPVGAADDDDAVDDN